MTPEERKVQEEAFNALRAVIEAYGEHNKQLRAQLRANRWYQFFLCGCILAIGLVRNCK